MKRCACMRYKELQHLKRDSKIWIYDNQYGLIPFNCLYPLVNFDLGNAVPICPYYLYIKDGIRIADAFFRQGSLREDEIELITKAVENCEKFVPLDTYEYIENRHAIILGLIAKRMKVQVDKKLFDRFYDFLQYRSIYLDIAPCLVIPPIRHDERMSCINECWFLAFEEYLKRTL